MSDKLEKVSVEEMRKSIRDKILRCYENRARVVIDQECVTQDVLKAFVILDLAYEMVFSMKPTDWKYTKKMQKFNEVHKQLQTAINLPYSRMPEYEVIYINDLMDKMRDDLQRNAQFLFYAVNNQFMGISTEKRKLLCDTLLIAVICDISRQVFRFFLKKDIPSITKAMYSAYDLARLLYADYDPKNAKTLTLDQVKPVSDAKNAFVNKYRELLV